MESERGMKERKKWIGAMKAQIFIEKSRLKYTLDQLKELPHIKAMIVLLVITVVLLAMSYFFQCKDWLSSLLMSISTGCITGLILYFLANLRSNEGTTLKKEIARLRRLKTVVRDIFAIGYYYQNPATSRFYDKTIRHDADELMEQLDILEEARNSISYSVYDMPPTMEFDPLDRDNINSYREMIARNYDDEDRLKQSVIDISEQVYAVEWYLAKLIEEREQKLPFIEQHFL